MPRADAHVHLFASGFAGPFGPPPRPHDDLAEYERLRRHHGIERALVVGYEREPAYAGNNAYVLDLARRHPWIAPAPYLAPAPAPGAEELRRLRAHGAAGFSLYLADAADADAVASWPDAVLRELRDARAILSLNARPEATAALGGTIDRLEGCTVLFSHLGLPGSVAGDPARAEVERRLAPLLALAGRGHVGVKLSGLYAVSEPPHDFPHASARPFVERLLDAFGPRRLYWGSDFAPALDFVSFAQTADLRVLAGCSDAEIQDIAGGNLLRLLDPEEG